MSYLSTPEILISFDYRMQSQPNLVPNYRHFRCAGKILLTFFVTFDLLNRVERVEPSSKPKRRHNSHMSYLPTPETVTSFDHVKFHGSQNPFFLQFATRRGTCKCIILQTSVIPPKLV